MSVDINAGAFLPKRKYFCGGCQAEAKVTLTAYAVNTVSKVLGGAVDQFSSFFTKMSSSQQGAEVPMVAE
jgi:hypothetical protein